MSKILLNTVETYRVDTESEVTDFIEAEKEKANDDCYILKTHSVDYKEKKQKGEIIDSCYVVKLTKVFETVWGNL